MPLRYPRPVFHCSASASDCPFSLRQMLYRRDPPTYAPCSSLRGGVLIVLSQRVTVQRRMCAAGPTPAPFSARCPCLLSTTSEYCHLPIV